MEERVKGTPNSVTLDGVRYVWKRTEKDTGLAAMARPNCFRGYYLTSKCEKELLLAYIKHTQGHALNKTDERAWVAGIYKYVEGEGRIHLNLKAPVESLHGDKEGLDEMKLKVFDVLKRVYSDPLAKSPT